MALLAGGAESCQRADIDAAKRDGLIENATRRALRQSKCTWSVAVSSSIPAALSSSSEHALV